PYSHMGRPVATSGGTAYQTVVQLAIKYHTRASAARQILFYQHVSPTYRLICIRAENLLKSAKTSSAL
ncbi:hypothetical protein, partial [Klebsiella pneumoniae]|uniref:hypothetical protein n=1 Tax=Klebsiella pneumoniae TaxID=573 RepID=UPI0036D3DC38